MALLDGKTGLIFGVANKRSIAWAIAQALSREGMRLAFTYQGDRLKEGVESLSSTLKDSVLLPCDVTRDEEIDSVYREVDAKFGRLDALVHSVAFAPREDLEGDYVKTSREGFKMAHDISAYSLVALTRGAVPLMEKNGGGAVLAMTYYGAEKAVEGYNLMGVAKASLEASVRYLAANLGPRNVRVNAISAGPVNTLAARGIGTVRVGYRKPNDLPRCVHDVAAAADLAGRRGARRFDHRRSDVRRRRLQHRRTLTSDTRGDRAPHVMGALAFRRRLVRRIRWRKFEVRCHSGAFLFARSRQTARTAARLFIRAVTGAAAIPETFVFVAFERIASHGRAFYLWHLPRNINLHERGGTDGR